MSKNETPEVVLAKWDGIHKGIAAAAELFDALRDAIKQRDEAREALKRIYEYRSDEPDWNMVMAIAGDVIYPQVMIPSERDK